MSKIRDQRHSGESCIASGTGTGRAAKRIHCPLIFEQIDAGVCWGAGHGDFLRVHQEKKALKSGRKCSIQKQKAIRFCPGS